MVGINLNAVYFRCGLNCDRGNNRLPVDSRFNDGNQTVTCSCFRTNDGNRIFQKFRQLFNHFHTHLVVCLRSVNCIIRMLLVKRHRHIVQTDLAENLRRSAHKQRVALRNLSVLPVLHLLSKRF